MRSSVLSVVLAAMLPGLPAVAGDLSVYAGAGLTFDNSRLTDDDDTTKGIATDLNLYVEGEWKGFYAGLSGDVINDTDANYVDVYAGYRNSLDNGLSYDLSYDKTIYPSDSDSNYGTVAISLGMPVSDKATLTFDGDYYIQAGKNTSDGYLTLDYALNDKITLTASMGLIENAGGGTGGASKDFELAASYQISDTLSTKLHYYKGDDYDGYFALDLNWDTTLLGG